MGNATIFHYVFSIDKEISIVAYINDIGDMKYLIYKVVSLNLLHQQHIRIRMKVPPAKPASGEFVAAINNRAFIVIGNKRNVIRAHVFTKSVFPGRLER